MKSFILRSVNEKSNIAAVAVVLCLPTWCVQTLHSCTVHISYHSLLMLFIFSLNGSRQSCKYMSV